MNKIFEGLNVIELASVLAGPSVGMFFAELGAKVIKVENKNLGGDITRQWKLAVEEPKQSISAYYSSVNWGKESIFLNLDESKDKDTLLKLIKDADILLINFKPGDAEKWDLNYEALKSLNQRLIYAELTGFPNSKRTAYDMVLQAESGFLSMNGEKGRNPVKLPVAFIDLFAGHQLKEGILIALLNQRKKPGPKKVSVNLYDSALASLANQASNYLMSGEVPQSMGSLHPNIAPYGETFSCSDSQKIVLAIGSDQQFIRFCKEIKAEEIGSDPLFSTNELRVKNRIELAKRIQPYIKKYQGIELSHRLIEKGIPVALIKDLKMVFESPDAKERILEENKEGVQLKTIKSVAFKIED